MNQNALRDLGLDEAHSRTTHSRPPVVALGKRGWATSSGDLQDPNLLPPVCVVLSPGCLGTAAALTYGLYCFHRGQSHRSQLMMRTRIAAQGFTVAAILLGLAASAMKSRP